MGSNGVAASGITGLDHILLGGFPRNRVYLVQGDPGVGKTTLGLQFLLEGVRNGEKVLYITREAVQSERAPRRVAAFRVVQPATLPHFLQITSAMEVCSC